MERRAIADASGPVRLGERGCRRTPPGAALWIASLLWLASVACSASVRTRVLGVVFDGVPPPGAKAEAKAQKAEAKAQADGRKKSRGQQPALAMAPAEAEVPAAPPPEPVIPPAPFESHKTWQAVLRALPVDVDGGVDWARAFAEGLATPRLLPRADPPSERPVAVDTLFDVLAGDPRKPALHLDVRMVPSANRSFEGGDLYEVVFPHSSHTAWLGCASCHPGIQTAKTDMLGILKGGHCGRCHGRVSFAPQVSCSRCHQKLTPLAADAFEEEVEEAAEQPVTAGPEAVERGKAVYHRLCAICHGEAGDGKGPMSEVLDPKPRDFTAGKYKFRTTLPSSIPTDLDIFKTITRGVAGTSMPAFPALPREDRWALTQFVKTLSDKFATSKPEPIPMKPPPEVTEAVLAEGLELWKQAGCNPCHGDSGHGDGPSAAALKDDWGNPLRPFNFASGRPIKGGSGADAIYRTIMTGLQGTPMPGFGDALTPEQGWALASYVRTLFGTDKEPFAVRGDIPFVRTEEAQRVEGANDYPPVVFPHWFHRIRVKCASCHPRLFEMKAGANPITMTALRSGKFCGTCHNGKTAFEIGFPTCSRCHLTPGQDSTPVPSAPATPVAVAPQPAHERVQR